MNESVSHFASVTLTKISSWKQVLHYLLVALSWTPVLQGAIRVRKGLPLLLGPWLLPIGGSHPAKQLRFFWARGTCLAGSQVSDLDKGENEVSRPQKKVSCRVQRKKVFPMLPAPVRNLMSVELKSTVHLGFSGTNNLVWNWGSLICTWWQLFPALQWVTDVSRACLTGFLHFQYPKGWADSGGAGLQFRRDHVLQHICGNKSQTGGRVKRHIGHFVPHTDLPITMLSMIDADGRWFMASVIMGVDVHSLASCCFAGNPCARCCAVLGGCSEIYWETWSSCSPLQVDPCLVKAQGWVWRWAVLFYPVKYVAISGRLLLTGGGMAGKDYMRTWIPSSHWTFY